MVARVVDTRRGSVVTEAQGTELADHVDRAGDAVAVEIMQQAGGVRRLGRAVQSRLGSRSPTAMRAFLGGEQFYRRGMLDSAVARYKEAIEGDSSFTLAYWHLGRIFGWHGDEDPRPVSLSGRSANAWARPRRQGAHSRGLDRRGTPNLVGPAESVGDVLACPGDARGSCFARPEQPGGVVRAGRGALSLGG